MPKPVSVLIGDTYIPVVCLAPWVIAKMMAALKVMSHTEA
jgi:hypothetical protein